jgi:hypothetical protein
MTQENRSRAHKIVETFRGELSDSVQSDIGEGGFKKLTLMINEGIQEDRKEVEEVVKALRKDIDIPELGM